MSRLLLGVDGGASKTIALVADEAGTVLGAGRAGSSDIHSEEPPSRAVENVAAATREALDSAGAAGTDLAAAVFGLCGADWPEDHAFYRERLGALLALPGPPTVVNDAFNSLRTGSDDGLGVALVLGTGGAIAAIGPLGAWFSGERLERLGAMELGRTVYDALVRAEYAEGSRPAFERAALARFGVESVEALVYAITRTGGTGWRSVAALAPALLEAANEGDAWSRAVVREHGVRSADYVRAAGRRVGLGPDGCSLVLAGGLLRGDGSLLRDALADSLPEYRVGVARMEPAHGALLLAADEIGIRLPTERLAGTGPQPDYFATAEASD